MEKVSGENAFEEYCNILKKRKKYSNSYLTPAEVEAYLKQDLLDIYKDKEDALFMINKKENAAYFYFLCDTWEWLKDISEIKNKYPILLASIVKKGALEEYKVLLDHIELIKEYHRLRTGSILIPVEETELSYYFCTKEEKGQLRWLMDSTFDIIGDHMPLDCELEEFIRKKNIICTKQDSKIIGFIIFEDKGKTSYVRMVCIDSNTRGQGIGKKLMQIYFKLHKEYKSFTLWCRADNERALKLYTSLGYQKEDIHDYIFKV